MESGGEEVKLLGAWFSPFVVRTEWALKLKGVSYELIPEEDLGNKSPLLLQSNPIHQKIPVLFHGHKPILESLLIVEYIDETWNHQPFLLPRDPLHKAIAKFWAKFIDEKLTEAVRTAIVTKGEEQEKAVKQAREALETIEREVMSVDKGLVLVGADNKIGLVDIALGWIAIWLTVVEEAAQVNILDSLKCPLTLEWMNNFLAVPAVKENVPPRDKLVAYFTNLRRAYVG